MCSHQHANTCNAGKQDYLHCSVTGASCCTHVRHTGNTWQEALNACSVLSFMLAAQQAERQTGAIFVLFSKSKAH